MIIFKLMLIVMIVLPLIYVGFRLFEDLIDQILKYGKKKGSRR